nr:protein MAK16 homolog [Tanacetum cinerariifolium]
SRYATIRDHEGVFYLYMKTIERAHMPNKLWERIKLPRNYEKALEIIDQNLMYWPKFLVHKAKQRLTKMTQMRIRMRKLALKTRLIIANIEKELVERVMKGTYGDIYNYHLDSFNKFIDEYEEETEFEVEKEYVAGYEGE